MWAQMTIWKWPHSAHSEPCLSRARVAAAFEGLVLIPPAHPPSAFASRLDLSCRQWQVSEDTAFPHADSCPTLRMTQMGAWGFCLGFHCIPLSVCTEELLLKSPSAASREVPFGKGNSQGRRQSEGKGRGLGLGVPLKELDVRKRKVI